MFRAPSGPAAREIATREPAARSGRSRSPPWPSEPSGALHTGGAVSLTCGRARRLVVRPGPAGPAVASGRGLVRVCLLWPCRRSPHRRRLWFWCECPGPAVASGRGLPGTVVQLSSFACNSPRASCLFVLVRAAESLLFGNCMRLWRGRVMGHMARGVARGMWRWGEVRGRADDRVKGLPCGT